VTARRFYAGTASTDGGNNTGWLFYNRPIEHWKPPLAYPQLYWRNI